MLNVNVINAKNSQKIEVKPGQPASVKVEPGTRFELADAATGKAPAQIKGRRNGDNLEIVVDEKAQVEEAAASNAQSPDLVLENYYKQEDVSLFAGTGEAAVSYVPVDGAAANAYAAMNTSANTGAAVAALPIMSSWMGVAAAGTGLALAGGGGGGSTPVTNKAPVAKDDAKSVEENSTLTGTVPTATDADGTVVRYEVTENVKITDGILRFNSNGTYTFNPSGFDYLAEGEKATVSFKYVAVDSFGAKSEPKTVTITMVGKNDAPEIVAVDSTDNFSWELTETNEAKSITSSLTIRDNDISDDVIYQPTPIKVDFKGTTFLDIDNFSQESKDPIVEYVMGLLTLEASPGKFVNDPHNLIWTFAYDHEGATFFDLIPNNKKLVLNYTIQVEDAQKIQKNAVISITINGTDDAPVISFESNDSFSKKIDSKGLASGTMTVFDFDGNYPLTSKVNGVKIYNVSDIAQLNGLEKLNLKDLIEISGTFYDEGTSNNLTWSFNGSSLLGKGADKEYELVYDISIIDKAGLESHQNINILFAV